MPLTLIYTHVDNYGDSGGYSVSLCGFEVGNLEAAAANIAKRELRNDEFALVEGRLIPWFELKSLIEEQRRLRTETEAQKRALQYEARERKEYERLKAKFEGQNG